MWVKTLFRAFRLAEISIAIFFTQSQLKPEPIMTSKTNVFLRLAPAACISFFLTWLANLTVNEHCDWLDKLLCFSVSVAKLAYVSGGFAG